MFKKMKKKGVSPLIATVLLVGITVAIAGALYAWINSTMSVTKSGAEKEFFAELDCANTVDFDIAGITCTAADNKITEVKIYNKFSKDIKSYTAEA